MKSGWVKLVVPAHPFVDIQSDIQNYIETLWCYEQRGHQQSHVSVP
jgi:hypothetical protein